MRLARLYSAATLALLALVGVMLSQILSAQWRELRASEEGLQVIEIAAKAMIAAEKVSAERGPANGVLGDGHPPDAIKAKRLADARRASDEAIAAAREATQSQDRDPMRASRRLIERASAMLQEARASVDQVGDLLPVMRTDERVMGSVHQMFDVIPVLMQAVNLLSRDAETHFPEFSGTMSRARLASELREYAGRLGSQFTAALAQQKPLAPIERQQVEQLRGRLDELRFLIEARSASDELDPRVGDAIRTVEDRYFGDGLGFVDSVLRLSDSARPYGLDTSEFAARYVPDMASIVQLRDVLVSVAIEHARDAHEAARQSLFIGAASGALAIAVVAALFVVGMRRVVSPLQLTTRALIDLAHGEMDTELPPAERPDEIGDVIRAVAVLRTSGLERQRLESERQRLIDELEVVSKTDFLTGILNRRAFIQVAGIQLINAQRYNWKMALMVFDLDHFKRVNDRYGHEAGDTVLVEVASAAKQRLRQGDYLARHGGEEFAALAIQADRATARTLAERMRAGIEAVPIELSGGQVVHVTASFGVACFEGGATDIEALFRAADRALYSAKEGGRNRVVIDGD
jgi:diguanylate cyclase (GGDEF)-like protein